MTYELYAVSPGKYKRISQINHVISINWDDDIDRIYLNFSFSSTEKLEVGDWIELYNKYDNKTVFYGIITHTNQSNEYTYSYTGYDLGFFVEKNKITIQYKKPTKLDDAIKQILKEVEIPTDNIPACTETVKRIYKTKTVSDILKDILKKSKKTDYFYSCKLGFVTLLKHTENDNLKAYIANIYSLKSINTINNFNISSSIENMKNKVAVLIDEKNEKEYIKEDAENIAKFGILQEAIEPQNGDKNYKKLAEDTLKELNKITKELSLTVLSDSNMQMGVIIPIKKEKIGLNDKYLIKASNHSIEGTKETVTIKLELYNG